MKHPVVFIVRKETTLAEVLARIGEEGGRALEEGRLFVGARRATRASQPVAAGDEVRMYPAREPSAERPRILAQRGGIVAAYKPATMATVADHRGAAGTLEREVAMLLGTPKTTLTPTSRLDVGVSGVVLFARDDEARRQLARARERGRYRRHYVGIVRGVPDPWRGVWSAPIGRARDPRKREVGGTAAIAATMDYAVVATAEAAAPKDATSTSSLIAIEPRTGRTHQIRVHAAHAGCPLFGDATYGGPARHVTEHGSVLTFDRVALHAAWVEVALAHAQPLRVEAPLPDDLVAIWTALGGDSGAWSIAAAALVADE